ncbi:MAG TPA: CPBP family intramembrane glutamic endopeptidase [Myxococcota bacterium]
MRPRIALTLAGLAALAAPLLPLLARGQISASDAALWQTLATQLCWCGLALLFALQVGGSVRERLGLLRGGLSAPRLLLGALGTLALSGALQFAVDALGLLPGSSLERLDSLASASAPSSPWLALAALGIAPGLGEELLFRGAIQRSLGRALGAWCVPIAALAFAALHADPVQSPAAFALGCYLGALGWVAASSWLPIACHIANNCAALAPQLSSAASALLPRPGSWMQAAVWLVVSSLALGWMFFSQRSASRSGAASG